MTTARAFAGKHYAVLGLARSGLATVEALLASGAKVTAWDDNPETVQNLRSSRAKSRDMGTVAGRVSTSLDTNGLEFADLDSADLTQFDSIVLSPGVPLNRSPLAQCARAAGLAIIGDIDLFARARAELPPHKMVGITGTNGKSTTTALVHHILQTAGVPSLMGGNIGLPILAQDPLPDGGVYVLELSSYQLDLTQSLDCDVAVLLNITPDHLDRYESFEAYADSKARLFEIQSPDRVRIFATDEGLAGVLFRQMSNAFPNVWMGHGGFALDRHDLFGFDNDGSLRSADHQTIQRDWPSLQGPHNAENAVAAVLTTLTLDVSPECVSEGLSTYQGLPHRTERVAEKHGVQFVNDRKATNPTATAPALAAFPAIRWILGGQAKSDNLDECAPFFSHVRSAYTIGEAGELFARLLGPHMPVAECGTLDAAVRAAVHDAKSGDTVLLSPACASFDQFKDFEARGEAFREYVRAL
ncbi:MAG: UDP-N-acetylmuramoyl-L-alanine--D-glutamate ligase [Sphingomicrobium sp.]